MIDRITTIRIEGITKMFGAVRALTNVTLEIGEGEVVAVMGKNGAGKSTFLSVLSLSMRPSRGQILFNGTPARALMPDIYSKIGLLSHAPLVYPDLTCRENLLLFAGLIGLESPAKRVADLEATMGMNEFAADRPARVLSRGQLQRVSLSRALLSEPDLLLLDEPAAGLDREATGRIRDAIEALTKRGGMAVVITHEPALASSIASRAVMIRRGTVIADETAPDELEGWQSLYAKKLESETP